MCRIFRDQILNFVGNKLDDGPEMVEIPTGRYLRGSPETEAGREDSEGPQSEVTMGQPFAMGATPITVGQYKLYLAHRKRFPDRQWDEQDLAIIESNYTGWWSKHMTLLEYKALLESREFLRQANPDLRRLVACRYQQADHFPVHYINWYDARGYAQWLSECTGQSYRLPSEAEWEYAARAGTATPYFWGESMSEELEKKISASHYALYLNGMRGRNRRGFSPAKFFPPNAWGIYRSYRVAEWCEDAWHANYVGAPNDGSVWIANDRGARMSDLTKRVLRGDGARSARRRGDGGCYRCALHGFRVARDIK